MKKLLALLLICVMAFAVVSCDDEEPVVDVQDPNAVFDVFYTAIDQTPADKITLDSKFTSAVGVLESKIITKFNPNGSATIDYYIEDFNGDSLSSEIKDSINGVVTLNKDGSYSDGGTFQGLLGANIPSVNLSLDSAKLASYSIEGGVLSATVAAANTAAVFGVAIAYDVNFMLTVSNSSVISLVISYVTELGTMETLVTYG